MADGNSGNGQNQNGPNSAVSTESILDAALVAPVKRRESGFNTIRSGIIPKGCFTVEDSHFEFDSSFVLPLGLTFDAQPLKKLMEDHPGSKLSIFGHTDPVGKDSYNKTLSGRRAQAVFGLLTRNVELWKDLYFHHDTQGNDPWGVRSIQIMLNRVGPTKAGNVQGVLDDDTRQALKDFEEANSLPAKGFNQKQEVDAGTFEVLAKLYMDATCTDDDNNPVQFTPDDFLARGAGKDGKGDFQGCGEFNPLLMFSKDEKTFFDQEQNKDARNKENQVNRRIMILLYRADARIDPEKWPCPSVKEGPEKCQLRFFANAKERRSNLDQRREHKDERDNPDQVGTFACRFYARQTSDSPCEGGIAGMLHMQIFDGEGKTALTGHSYQIHLSDDSTVRFSGVLNDDGILRHINVPDGNYVLKVDGCDEETPMFVLDRQEVQPTVRYLETSSLAVFVRTVDGAPIEGAKVTVDGIGDAPTDGDGIADFGFVPPGAHKFRVSKEDHEAVPTEKANFTLTGDSDVSARDDSASGTVVVGGRKAKPQVQLNVKQKAAVKEVRATLQGTRGLRNPTVEFLAANTLKSSTSDSTTPIDNVVLVRCDNEVDLEAITDPANESVTWSISANQSQAAPPTLTPDQSGTKAKVKTDKAGSFMVSAKIGKSVINWNFVVVGLDVDVKNAKVNTRNSFADMRTLLKNSPNLQGFSLPPDMVAPVVGEFQFGKHAWDSEVSVKLIGGGPNGDIGIDKIKPRYLQNVLSSDVQGKYSQGARADTAFKNPALGRVVDPSGGATPNEPAPVIGKAKDPATGQIVDVWPVCNSAGMMQLSFPNSTDKSVVVIKMGDAPAGGAFKAREAVQGSASKRQQLERIAGFTKFAAAVASWSPDAPNTIAVHAACEWLADFDGPVEFPDGDTKPGVYKLGFGHMALVRPWHLVGPPTGGLEARAATFEIFKPLAVEILNTPTTTTF